MKRFGILLVLCMLMCTFGTQPVTAQEPEVGFIPLLSADYDASVPREVSSQASYDRLLPRLMEAKASGMIADFSPDFYGGYVKVFSPSTALRGASGLFPVYFTREEAVVKPLISALEQGNRTAPSVKVYMSLYSSYMDIYTDIPNAHVIGTLKSPAGEVLGVLDAYADSEGDLWDYWDGYNDSNTPGYKVSLKFYNASEVLVGTYSITIPRLTFKTVDKATGKMTGSAPVGKPFLAYMDHPNLNAAGDWYSETISGTVSGTGNWSADFDHNFRGGDYLGIQIEQTSNFTFYRSMQAPRVACMLQSNRCWIENLPNKTVELTVTHGGVPYKFSGKTGPYGEFYGYLYNSSGDPVLVLAGDKVAGTDATTENVPKLTLTASRAANTVSGIAPANKWFQVAIYLWDPFNYEYAWTHSGSTGAFTASFSLDIPAKGTIEPDIWYYNPSTGNYWYYYKIIP